MKLRTVVIASLLAYAVFFREGDNEYVSNPYLGSLLSSVYDASRAGGEPGAWLVFERMILLRYHDLPNQGRSAPPARTMSQTPKPPKGWVAMTMPAFLQALGTWVIKPTQKDLTGDSLT